MTSENVSWMVTIVGLIGILALLLVLICRYLGWTEWSRAWLTSSREEKMILTKRGGPTGQYHPNGFMIPSDSDLNISGGGSFRRFDRTIDYHLLRQGSTVSIPSQQQQQQQQQNSSNIPPQPLRPAPFLPVSSAAPTTAAATAATTTASAAPDSVMVGGGGGSEVQRKLEQQSDSVDSVFMDSPLSSPMPPPPPRIPPPPPSATQSAQSAQSTTTTTTSSHHQSSASNNSSGSSRALPSFSMTNPFLPLLQASTQFFSQTLQGLQSLQNSTIGQTPSASQQQQQPPPPPPQNRTMTQTKTTAAAVPANAAATAASTESSQSSSSSQNNHYGYTNSYARSSSSTSSSVQNTGSSSTTTKLSMGELLFSAPPATVTSPATMATTTATTAAVTDLLMDHNDPSSSSMKTTETNNYRPGEFMGQNFSSSSSQRISSTDDLEPSLSSPIKPSLPSSNPFSPQSSFVSSSFDDETNPSTITINPTTTTSSTCPPPSSFSSSSRRMEGEENYKNYQQDITNDNNDNYYGVTVARTGTGAGDDARNNIFNWTTTQQQQQQQQPIRPTTISTTTISSNIDQRKLDKTADDPYNVNNGVNYVRPQLPPPPPMSSDIDQLLSKNNSIFDQIRDFNQLSMSRNEKDDEELMKQLGGNTTTQPPPPQPSLQQLFNTDNSNPISGSNVSKFKSDHVNNKLVEEQEGQEEKKEEGKTEDMIDEKNLWQQNNNGNNDIMTTTNTTTIMGMGMGLTDNRMDLKCINSSSVISTVTTGGQGGQGHYSNFTPYRTARSFSLRQSSTDSIGSDGSDLASPDGSPLPSLQRAMSCDSVCSNSSVSELPPHLAGHLCIGLEYDSETADLLVNVIEAKEINPDATMVRCESNGKSVAKLDTYVRVYLLPDKTTNMQTRVYRKSLNPIYKEKFMFGLELTELPIRSLVFYMYATDKSSNTLIGEAELKLGDLDIQQLPRATWLPLTDTGQFSNQQLGEIMFSLSYLPTAERLTVVVVKGRNLKFPRENVGDPFVKVYLLQRGKKVSKKKSSTKRGEKNPIFNEAMIFGVPAHALQTIQLRITVADSAEAESNRAYSIGHVIVGSTATGKPLSHWNQMLSSLRKPIAMWHPLRK